MPTNMRTSTTQQACANSITRAFAARIHVGPIVVSERTQRKTVDGSSEKYNMCLVPPDKHAHCCMLPDRCACVAQNSGGLSC